MIAERVVESVGMRGGGPQEGEDFRAFSRNRAPVMPNRISSTATASSLAVCVCVIEGGSYGKWAKLRSAPSLKYDVR